MIWISVFPQTRDVSIEFEVSATTFDKYVEQWDNEVFHKYLHSSVNSITTNI